jgi:hypothetical protein
MNKLKGKWITMDNKQAMDILLKHKDPVVRAAAVLINTTGKRRKRILALVQEALQQLRVDMKYLVFDLECTRRERDAAK